MLTFVHFTRRKAEVKCILVTAICVSVCLSLATFLALHYCMDLDVHHWADLQSVHAFHCYDNIHSSIQYYRMLLQCKWILIDVNAIWTTPSHVQQKLAPNVKC